MTRARPRRDSALVVAGIVAVALNLRPSITSVSPILELIRTDLGLSYTAVSLLTTIPTVCMGVFAFGVRPLSRRLGPERAVFWGVLVVGVATLARSLAPSVFVLFGTTLALGVGIAVIQTLLPTLVQLYCPDRAAIVTGLYTAGLIAGAALGAGLTAPVVEHVGSWPLGLGFWAVLAAVAGAVWYPIVRDAPSVPTSSSEDGAVVWRSPLAWYVTLYFGGNAVVYFSVLAWLPPRYVALGWSPGRAGALLTVFTLAELVGTLGFTRLADGRPDRRPSLAVTVFASGLGLAGVATAPLVAPWFWSLVSGIGTGGLFGLCLTLPVDYTTQEGTTARLTSLVLGIGYLVAAAGPLAVGGLKDVFGGYVLSFWTLAGVCGLLLVMTVWLRPDREID